MIRNISIAFIELITRLHFLYIFSYSVLKISHISDFVMLYFSVSCTSWKIYENFQFSLPNVFTWTLEWMSTVFSSNVTGLSQRLLGVHWGAEGLYLIIIVLVSLFIDIERLKTENGILLIKAYQQHSWRTATHTIYLRCISNSPMIESFLLVHYSLLTVTLV